MNKVSEKVLDFYKIMPFNIYGDTKIACNNIKKNPIYETYPFLTKSLESSGSILDIGCGGGWLVNNIGYHYKSKKITGIDFNPIAIKFASEVSKKLNLSNTFEVQDLFKFKQEGFDLILSMGVLHHTDDCLADPERGEVLVGGIRAPIAHQINKVDGLLGSVNGEVTETSYTQGGKREW